jgi:hypothetical protein
MWTELITVAETLTFMRQAEGVWNDEEREAFVDFIARNPEAGDVIPETGGVRKIRWSMQGKGQARRHAGHLLFPRPERADLSVDGLCKEGSREHFARSEKVGARVRRAH